MAEGPAPITPPAGPLPETLAAVGERVGVQDIDELWIFPPRRSGSVESGLVVVSAFEEAGPGRRRVLTARYLVRTDPRTGASVERELEEHGSAPADRVPRVVDGVLRRLHDQLADQPPRPVEIRGDPARWSELLASLAG